ncbi:hypothetical protein D3C79_834400 [compost metagenome]
MQLPIEVRIAHAAKMQVNSGSLLLCWDNSSGKRIKNFAQSIIWLEQLRIFISGQAIPNMLIILKEACTTVSLPSKMRKRECLLISFRYLREAEKSGAAKPGISGAVMGQWSRHSLYMPN